MVRATFMGSGVMSELGTTPPAGRTCRAWMTCRRRSGSANSASAAASSSGSAGGEVEHGVPASEGVEAEGVHVEGLVLDVLGVQPVVAAYMNCTTPPMELRTERSGAMRMSSMALTSLRWM